MEVSSSDFHKIMLEIDDELAKANPIVYGREMRALSKFGERFPAWSCIVDRNNPVIQWYELMYRDRLKGTEIGTQAIVLLRFTPYRVNFPLTVYGRVQVNPFKFIEHATDAKLASLDAEMVKRISVELIDLWNSINILNRFAREKWYGDLTISVASIMRGRKTFGLAKWAAQQMVEKSLKAYIVQKNGQNSTMKLRTHDLKKLSEIASKYGLKLYEDLILNVNCLPGVRYEEEHISLESAVTAQHAALKLCSQIASGLGIKPDITVSFQGEE